MFGRWGRFVFRHPWKVMSLAAIWLVATLAALISGGSLSSSYLAPTEAVTASALITTQLPKTGTFSFDLVMSSPTLRVGDVEFKRAVAAALAGLVRDRRVAADQIGTPYTSAQAATQRTSTDGHAAAITVRLTESYDQGRKDYPALRALVQSHTLNIVATGQLAIASGFDTYLTSDLRQAEMVSLPLALILLLIVFGTLVAAFTPLSIGVLGIIGGMGGVYVLNRFTDVSQYALNILTLTGLGIAIDYSLFVVSRFREELDSNTAEYGMHPDLAVEAALSRTMATAGRAITFSGLTVMVGLSALIFFQGTYLTSLGAAGAIVVAIAVFYSVTFLPALLALLGPRINAFRLPLPRNSGRGFWARMAEFVMRHPVGVLVIVMPLLIGAGIPFTRLQLASSDVRALPPNSEAYRGYVEENSFPDYDQAPIIVVVRFPGSPLTPQRIGALYNLAGRLSRLSHVSGVDSVVTLPGIDSAGMATWLLNRPAILQPAAVRNAVAVSVGSTIVVLSVRTQVDLASSGARDLVQSIRDIKTAGDGKILVTSRAAYDLDDLQLLASHIPGALIYLVLATYLILFLLLGSVVLPIKALLTDLISVSASFGALVWIFQEGNLHGITNVTPAPIDPTVPVLLFCLLFGLSLDYEVFLLSRMKEAYETTKDNRGAVAEGLERSGRLITGAAAIMVMVFFTFGLAHVTLIKAIGLGLGIAVLLDATLVRALVVPAVMRLLGDVNWWAPNWLVNLHRRLGFAEPYT